MSDAADAEPSSSLPTSNGAPVTEHKIYLDRKRKEFICHMLRNFDIITYLHLTYLYFLEYVVSTAALHLAARKLTRPPKLQLR